MLGTGYYHSPVASPAMLVYCALFVLGGLYRLRITSLSSTICCAFHKWRDPMSTIGVVYLIGRAHIDNFVEDRRSSRDLQLLGGLSGFWGRRAVNIWLDDPKYWMGNPLSKCACLLEDASGASSCQLKVWEQILGICNSLLSQWVERWDGRHKIGGGFATLYTSHYSRQYGSSVVRLDWNLLFVMTIR